jgi:hypothetical protein
MDEFKQTLRELIKAASHTKCASFGKCKCSAKCGAFVPSAELYEEVTRLARKAVK